MQHSSRSKGTQNYVSELGKKANTTAETSEQKYNAETATPGCPPAQHQHVTLTESQTPGREALTPNPSEACNSPSTRDYNA